MNLDELVLHPTDRVTLKAAISGDGRGIMLVGDSGFGKETIAKVLASDITEARAYLTKSISPSESGSITIEMIRDLKKFFELKGSDSYEKRTAFIINADRMAAESQNALLKTLEEPPERAFIILTVSNINELLPTIISRCQVIRLTTPPLTQLQDKLSSYNGADQALKISAGLPGLALSIAKGENSATRDNIEKAKEIMSLAVPERLKMISSLEKDRQALRELLVAFKIICSGAIETLLKSSKESTKWQLLAKRILAADKMLDQNVSTKLVLTQLFINL